MAPFWAITSRAIKVNDGKFYKIKSFINGERIFLIKKDDFLPKIIIKAKILSPPVHLHHMKIFLDYPWSLISASS